MTFRRGAFDIEPLKNSYLLYNSDVRRVLYDF